MSTVLDHVDMQGAPLARASGPPAVVWSRHVRAVFPAVAVDLHRYKDIEPLHDRQGVYAIKRRRAPSCRPEPQTPFVPCRPSPPRSRPGL